MPPATALPKHVQISEALIREIGAGRLIDGERLPPERKMAAQWGVSVGTLRKALADLEGQGLLARVQGSGNYVRQAGGPVGIYAFFRLELVRGGGLPTAEVLSVETLGGAHRIRRLRRLNGIAAAVEEISLDASLAAGLDAADLSESLYLHYRREFGLVVARVEDRIGVGERPGWAAALLPDEICGAVERVAFDAAGRQIEASWTWFDAAKVRYVNRMR